jgi:hypothetical protein
MEVPWPEEPGLAPIALEGVQQRRLFATDVRARSAVDHHVEREASAEDVVSQVPLGIGLVHRVAQPPRRVHRLAADVDDGVVGADRV